MKKYIYFISCFLLTNFYLGFAQVGKGVDMEEVGRFEARIFDNKRFSKILPYRFFTPDNSRKEKKYPLVIFMHGAGKPQGTDNIKQLMLGAMQFVQPEIQAKYPSFVMVPQCPRDVWWVNVKAPHGMPPEVEAEVKKEKGKKAFREKARILMNDPELYFPLDIRNITEPLQMVSDLIDEIIEKYPVNPDRVYITGGSMGGLGTWCLAYMNPKRVAAIAPLCSPSDPENAAMLKDIPTWVFHGDVDDYFPVKASRDMVKALNEAGNKNVKYTELPGVNHGGLSTKAYMWDENKDGEPDIITWLFAQKRQ